MDNIFIERTILSTVLMAEPFDIEHAKIAEIKEEWFSNLFHKSVVRHINICRQIGIVDELIVMEAMLKDGTYNDSLFIDILATNPFGSSLMFRHAITVLKSKKKKLHEVI